MALVATHFPTEVNDRRRLWKNFEERMMTLNPDIIFLVGDINSRYAFEVGEESHYPGVQGEKHGRHDVLVRPYFDLVTQVDI